MAHGLSCSAACGIFPDQGSNPCPRIGRQILNHCAPREALDCILEENYLIQRSVSSVKGQIVNILDVEGYMFSFPAISFALVAQGKQ